MSLDDFGLKAGRALREASKGLTGTETAKAGLSRIPTGVTAAIGVFVLTLLILGSPNLWRDGLDPSTRNDTAGTPTSTAGIGIPQAAKGFRLLGGGSVLVAADVELRIQSYSVFSEFAELGGERLVSIAQVADPIEIARTESATQEETLTTSASIWSTTQFSGPLFLSVDLGSWTAWLHIGSASDRPNTEALLRIVDQLAGTADSQGVEIPGLRFDYQEIGMAGTDGGTVIVRIGTCFREPVPDSEFVDHPRRGTLILTGRYASWCFDQGPVEVTVEGSVGFVNSVVDTLTLTFD
ncbi:MAG: hypothetical protein GXP36_10800 [Actinobacteria bacterium]|nr:hypothetical protein [Actinomycetota bacterium]